MAGQGTKILASDFNQIQTIIANVLGTGSGSLGYGQPVTSNQVTIGSKITASGWQQLRNDLIAARQHQTGNDESGNLTLTTTGVIVSEGLRSQYLTFANLVQGESNRIATSGQSTVYPISNISRSNPWSGTITHQIILNFGSSNAARYFFNSGSNIQFSASLDNTSTPLNSDWNGLLSAMGVITMNYNSTLATGSGSSAGSIGFNQLTSTPQTIFTKQASSYSGDQYQILASVDGTRSVLTFSIRFQASAPGPGGRVVEQVTGNLASTVQAIYASGSNVSMTTPTNYLPSVTQSGP
jgi:hypothetical protein